MLCGARNCVHSSGMQTASVVERAFQLAQSGQFTSVTRVRERLRGEGYTHADIAAHLGGAAVQKSLKALVARRPAAKSP
jgi:hypothetical protein